MAFTIICSTFIPGTTKAAEIFDSIKFPYKQLQIQVMPEFDYPKDWPKDKPVVLVGHYGTFINKSGKDYSGEISIKAPINEADFQVFLVADFPEANKPEVQRPYEINKKDGTITWKPGTPIKKDAEYQFVIEYYYNPIKVGDNKKFSYSFTSEADAEQVDIIFYAPIGATKVKVDKDPYSKTNSEYGEEVYHYQYAKMKAKESKEYTMSYVKKNNDSTVSKLNEATPPNDADHEGVAAGQGAQAPNDETHAGLEGTGTATEQVLQNSGLKTEGSNSDRPIIDITGASIIGGAIILLGVFIFLGLRGKSDTNIQSKKAHAGTRNHATKQAKKKQKTNSNNASQEKKKLRKMLMDGEIDKKEYDERISKLG